MFRRGALLPCAPAANVNELSRLLPVKAEVATGIAEDVVGDGNKKLIQHKVKVK